MNMPDDRWWLLEPNDDDRCDEMWGCDEDEEDEEDEPSCAMTLAKAKKEEEMCDE